MGVPLAYQAKVRSECAPYARAVGCAFRRTFGGGPC